MTSSYNYRTLSYEYEAVANLQIFNQTIALSKIFEVNVEFEYGRFTTLKAKNNEGTTCPIEIDEWQSVFVSNWKSTKMCSSFTAWIEFYITRKVKEAPKSFISYWNSSAKLIPYQHMTSKDFVFVIDGVKIPIHKFIISEVSEIIKKMFANEIRNGLNKAELTDIRPETFKCLLFFVYGDRVRFDRSFKSDVHEVYKAAHRFQIKNLEEYCIEYMFEHLTDPENAMKTFMFARQFVELEDLKKYCWEIIRL